MRQRHIASLLRIDWRNRLNTKLLRGRELRVDVRIRFRRLCKEGSEESAWEALGGIGPEQPSLKKMAFPKDLAKAVLFLASDKSFQITGTDLAVAGYTA